MDYLAIIAEPVKAGSKLILKFSYDTIVLLSFKSKGL